MGLPVLTCSSAATAARTRSPAAPRAASAPGRRPRTPRRRRAGSARRRAAPRPPASGTPRGSGRRTTPRGSSASRHISSPNSRKSATRPAFSSDWLSSSPLPGTLTSFQNSSRSAGIFCERRARRPPRVRAMPQYSHMSLPSSRWNESTVRAALDREEPLRALRVAASSASLELAARSVVTFSSFVLGEVVADRVREHEVAVGQALHQRATRRGGWRRGRRSSPRRGRTGPARCVIRL